MNRVINNLNYNNSILTLIEEIKNDFIKNIPHIKYILLTGSGGRDELSYLKYEGNIRLFSDLEFFVLIDHNKNLMSKIEKKRLQKKIASKYNNIKLATKFFHVDFTISTLDHIEKEQSMLAYETLQKSKLIYGDIEEYKKQIKSYRHNSKGIDNVDIKDINNILLYRHYSILNAISLSAANNFDYTTDMYAICRNSLDLLSIILYINKIYKVTYKEKVDYLNNINNCSKLKNNIFSAIINNSEFIEFINNSYCYKVNPYIITDNKEVKNYMKLYLKYSNYLHSELIKDEYSYYKTLSKSKLFMWRAYFSLIKEKNIGLYLKSLRYNYYLIYIEIDKILKGIVNDEIQDKQYISNISKIYKSMFPYAVE